MSSFQAPGDFSLSESVGKRVMTPGGAVAPGIAPELMPVLVLENDRPENMLLSYQRMFGRAQTVAAGAALTRASIHVLNNRTDMLVTVKSITAQVPFIVGILRIAPGTLPFGTQRFGLPRDSRINPGTLGSITPCSSAIWIEDNTLGNALSALIHSGVANSQWDIPIVLGPNDALYVAATTDASALTACSIQWQERRLNQSERL